MGGSSSRQVEICERKIITLQDELRKTKDELNETKSLLSNEELKNIQKRRAQRRTRKYYPQLFGGKRKKSYKKPIF